MGVNEFLRYSLSGYFFIGIIFLGIFFYPGILTLPHLVDFLSQIKENQIIASLLIALLGYPLGYAFYSIHQVFYNGIETRIFCKYQEEYKFLEVELKIKKRSYLMGLHHTVLSRDEKINERINYLSSLFHGLGSILIALILGGIVCLLCIFAYGKMSISNNFILLSVAYVIFSVCILYYRQRTLSLLQTIELIFVADKFSEIKKLHNKIRRKKEILKYLEI